MSTPQPAAAPVFSMSGRIGVWVHVTETMTGHIHDIQAAGFDYILLKIADGSAGANTYHLAALQRIVHDAATVNIPLVAWAYVTPTDIPGQVAAILKALPAGVNDLVLDAEIEFEQAAAPGGSLGPATTIMRIHQLCRAIGGTQGPAPAPLLILEHEVPCEPAVQDVRPALRHAPAAMLPGDGL